MKTAYIYPTNNASNKYSALQEEAVKRAGYKEVTSIAILFNNFIILY